MREFAAPMANIIPPHRGPFFRQFFDGTVTFGLLARIRMTAWVRLNVPVRLCPPIPGCPALTAAAAEI